MMDNDGDLDDMINHYHHYGSGAVDYDDIVLIMMTNIPMPPAAKHDEAYHHDCNYHFHHCHCPPLQSSLSSSLPSSLPSSLSLSIVVLIVSSRRQIWGWSRWSDDDNAAEDDAESDADTGMHGVQRWWMCPPEYEDHLLSADGGGHVFDFRGTGNALA